MYRIDSAGSVLSLPTPGALGTEGFWNNPNAGIGSDGTLIDADWLNMVQESFVAILAFAGIAHSKSDPTRVRQAISAMIANALGSYALSSALTAFEGNFWIGGTPPGNYVIHGPNGLKQMGGKVTFSPAGGTNANYALTFPTPFTGWVGKVHGTALGGSSSTHGYPPSISLGGAASLSGCTLVADNLSGVYGSPVNWDQPVDCYWSAEGV
jgi:hypothetical protein